MNHHSYKIGLKGIGAVAKKTVKAWMAADPFRQSAVIAYYAIFSMPALLVIVVACAGLAFGEEAVRGEISRQISSAMGHDTSKQVEDIIANASEKKSSIWATIISIVTLIVGCTGVFAQLHAELNRVWEVKVEAKKKWLRTLRDRLFSFGLVLAIGFLMLVSLVLTAGLTAFADWIKANMPDVMLLVFALLNFVVSFGVITVLFALMFKVLPDAQVRWRNVWIGAAVTAALFTLGKFLLGIYFGKADPGSTYGAAGSIVLIMLWVSYSCMIVFLGAEFTKQFTLAKGDKIIPRKDATLIEGDESAQEVREKREATRDSKI
jgi:membrane protein